eukprot:scaffold87036_cov75-Phaeocystis_antarctica.AAC.2
MLCCAVEHVPSLDWKVPCMLLFKPAQFCAVNTVATLHLAGRTAIVTRWPGAPLVCSIFVSRPGFTPQQLDGARRRARVGEVRAAAVIAMAVRGSREPGVGSGCWGVHQTC